VAYPLGLVVIFVFLGFEAGGYFADTTGWVAAALALGLAVSAAVLGRPPRGVTGALALAAGLLALFGLWVLLSASWSDHTAGALIEFDRVLLYLLALLLFGVAPRPRAILHRLPAAIALAAVILCGAGLLVRTLPHSWPFALPTPSERLDYPLSYENAQGALAALGLVFALHVASWTREAMGVRALAAAALPVLTVTLVLTFSRGATVVAIIGPLAYLVLARPRGALAALLATAPFVFLVAKEALDANLLATLHSRTPAAIAQGKDLAGLTAASSAAAGLLLAFLVAVERRVTEALSGASRRLGRGLVAGVALAAVVAIGIAAQSGGLGHLYRKVVQQGGGAEPAPVRGRLTNPSSFTDLSAQNRPKYWRVSLDAFERHPLRGTGAGTFPRLWARDRPKAEEAAEGHSIYFETLGELGLVGGVLLLAVIVLIVWSFGRFMRRPDRPLYACMLAATLTWLLHAGLDWDWEMPVLTLWLFAAGGCALALARQREPDRRLAWPWRALAAAGCALVALTPATVALSQSQLDDSVKALRRGDCPSSERSASDAASTLSLRPEPYELLAYCASRRGDDQLAIRRIRQAIDRDPHEWRFQYGLGIVLANAGRDPRAALRRAYRLDPKEPLVLGARRYLSTTNRRVLARLAPGAVLPLKGPSPPPTPTTVRGK
jgi:tetratricopeptide (TPR) repeat protein